MAKIEVIFNILKSLCRRKKMKQCVPLQKLIQERFSCIIRNSMRKISEMQNIQKDREAWFWTVCITVFCQASYSMYHTSFDLLFSTDEGRRWQRFVRLQPCCMRCWRQLYLLGKLMLRFDFYNFVIMSGILLITHFLDGNNWAYNVQLILSLQTERYAKDVAMKREQYEHYNILPLYALGVKPPIMELPEVVKMQLM